MIKRCMNWNTQDIFLVHFTDFFIRNSEKTRNIHLPGKTRNIDSKQNFHRNGWKRKISNLHEEAILMTWNSENSYLYSNKVSPPFLCDTPHGALETWKFSSNSGKSFVAFVLLLRILVVDFHFLHLIVLLNTEQYKTTLDTRRRRERGSKRCCELKDNMENNKIWNEKKEEEEAKAESREEKMVKQKK